MFSSEHDIGDARRIVGGLTILAFLFTTIQPSYAQSLASGAHPHGGAAIYAGHTAMFDLRIPFGGEAGFRSQPTVGMSVGPSWRGAPGAQYPALSNFMPTAEARLTFGGAPILKLGSFDVGQFHAAAEGAEASTFCGRNLGVCIAGGALIVVGVAAIVLGHTNRGFTQPPPPY